ncbi:MAG: SDR family oxidoreductase [Chloroflexi bacterium]|nr:SDR family oxidoreductase [Chloroflexota bacterium]
MILVVGATGYLGTDICLRLRDKGLPVRGLVRKTSDPMKKDHLRNLGVELVEGNLKDRPSLEAACKGVEKVITTATITLSRQPDDTIQNVDQAGQINLVDAARAAGVRHFVYTSYSKNLDTDSPLTTAKRAVELHLMRSGMSYTILRPACFMEVWLSPAVGFDFPHAKAVVYGAGEAKLSWISRGDVAAFAIAALEHPAARNAMLELGGPEALSPLQVVDIFEKATHRTFEVQLVPVEALRAQKAAATDSVQQSFAGLMLDYAKGDVIDMSVTLRTFPLKLTSVAEYAHHVLIGA